MIDLFYETGRKADLVAVRAVAAGRLTDDLLLRKLPLKRLGLRTRRVCSAGHAHRLVDIGPSGERIADRAAKAGGSTAERLDFRRVIVRLIFKVDEPLLFLSVHIDGNDDRAGIDLVGLFLIIKLSFFFELLRTENGEIHQADELVAAPPVHLVVICEISLEGIFDRSAHIAIPELHVLKLRGEGRVAAVIRPVCIEDTDLRDRRIPLLCILKISADEFEIRKCHGKIQ